MFASFVNIYLFSETCSITRRALFEVWWQETEKTQKVSVIFNWLLEVFGVDHLPQKEELSMLNKLRNFSYKVGQKWENCHRIKNQFLMKNSTWHEQSIFFSEIQNIWNTPSTSQLQTETSRPKKAFELLTNKSKKRRIQHLLENYSKEELTFAAQNSLYQHGQRGAANILKEVTTTSFSSKKATTYSSLKNTNTCKLSKEEALATYLDGGLTKCAYIAIQQRLRSKGSKMFPNYNKVLEAKSECYPKNLKVTEISAEVDLQNLIDHTINRLCLVQLEVLESQINCLDFVEILIKWGCDGSSGFSQYKQRYVEQNCEEEDDSAVFVISLVPIQMTCLFDNQQLVLWHNTTSSGTRFCRPIKILQKKESATLIKSETEKVEKEIAQLQPLKILIKNKEVSITPKLVLTMVDGKICSSLKNVSPQKCYICGCSPKEMNSTELTKNINLDPSSYSFGISPLHAKIRIFECLLKISYRLEFKKWQARDKSDKEAANRKREIIVQQKFKSQLGLLVDVVKQGFGTTNDGNTARRFFDNPKISAEITGLNEKLIHQFSVLLQTISCGFEVDINAFENFAKETLNNYLEHYSWYFMPVTMHKLLFHGAALIKHALVPIGQLSEEAQECRHKELKKFREKHSRKCSRKATMEDVFHHLLITSDPYINSFRKNP